MGIGNACHRAVSCGMIKAASGSSRCSASLALNRKIFSERASWRTVAIAARSGQVKSPGGRRGCRARGRPQHRRRSRSGLHNRRRRRIRSHLPVIAPSICQALAGVVACQLNLANADGFHRVTLLFWPSGHSRMPQWHTSRQRTPESASAQATNPLEGITANQRINALLPGWFDHINRSSHARYKPFPASQRSICKIIGTAKNILCLLPKEKGDKENYHPVTKRLAMLIYKILWTQ